MGFDRRCEYALYDLVGIPGSHFKAYTVILNAEQTAASHLHNSISSTATPAAPEFHA